MAGKGRKAFGAVMLGVGSIFVPKTDPREHWSIAPTTEIVSEDDGAETPGEA